MSKALSKQTSGQLPEQALKWKEKMKGFAQYTLNELLSTEQVYSFTQLAMMPSFSLQ